MNNIALSSPLSNPDKTISLKALDWLNFFLSIMRGGIGPYMVIYFSHIGFSASQIGSIVATLALSNAIGHIPAGELVDKIEKRRELIALAMFVIGLSILGIMFWHDFYVVLAIQVLVGFASSLIPPTLGALSLGLVGHNALASRLGRNDAFNHAGNVSVAICVGVGGALAPLESMMVLFITLCIISLIVIFSIKSQDINEDWARGVSGPEESNDQSASLKNLILDRDLLYFLIAIFMFHLTNSSLLPIVIQKIVKVCPSLSPKMIPMWSTSCILIAELVMIFAAVLAGRLANQGRKNIFMACYLLVALRAFIFAAIMQPVILVSAQCLDGLSAGMYSVVALTMLSDIVYGSGRFNLSQGIFNAFTATGIAISNYLAGIFIDNIGFTATCAIAALTTFISLLLIAKFIPETKNRSFSQASIR